MSSGSSDNIILALMCGGPFSNLSLRATVSRHHVVITCMLRSSTGAKHCYQNLHRNSMSGHASICSVASYALYCYTVVNFQSLLAVTGLQINLETSHASPVTTVLTILDCVWYSSMVLQCLSAFVSIVNSDNRSQLCTKLHTAVTGVKSGFTRKGRTHALSS